MNVRGLLATAAVASCAALGVLVPTAVAQAAEGGTCPNEAIRLEQGVSVLPDCRAYEMVSPVYQEGYPLEAFRFAGNGDQAVMAGYGNVHATGEGEIAAGQAAIYLDKRGVDGWELESLNAPLSRFVGEIPVAYEAETGVSLWIQHTPRQSAQTLGLYIRAAGGGGFSFVGPVDSWPGKWGRKQRHRTKRRWPRL
jgi:hypothetical protein